MNARVVCISRTMAAGGEAVGRLVADRLGFRYCDDEIILRAAEKGNVTPQTVIRAEQRRSFVDRVLESLSTAVVVGEGGVGMGVPMVGYGTGLAEMAAEFADFRALIRDVIREVARQGDAVIVAHAASMALADEEGVLRVLVTASPATRIARLSKAGRMPAEDAAKAVRDSDRDRREYFKRFYGISEEEPTHYDLVVNTDVFDSDQVVELVVCAARSPG